MKAKGNGDKKVCVQNLLAIVRGEAQYDRLRGLDARVIDMPGNDAEERLQQDAAWLLRTYEPRAEVQSLVINQEDRANGNFGITANIT